MTDLTSFTYAELFDDHMAAHINKVIAASLRPEYANTETISATKTLVDNDCQYQFLTASGGNQIVKLAPNAISNHPELIFNIGTSNQLIIQDSGGTTLAYIGPAGWIMFIPSNAQSWKIISSSSLVAPSSNPRNLIINGDMQIAQRSTSVASLTTAGYYTLDRWRVSITTLGTWTMSQTVDAPTGSGLRNCLKMLVTTADAAPAAADVANIQYRFEGQHLQLLRKGTSSAKYATASFWVKSNVTGTYIVELNDNDNSRQISASYTISSADTWEYKVVTFKPDTTGAFDNDNAVSLFLNFWLASGTDLTSGTLNTSWAATTNANRVVGQTNVAASINNYFEITGVQLEPDSLASAFEFTPFEKQLTRCLRYFFKTFPLATAPAQNAGVGGAFRFIAGKAGAAAEFGSLLYPVPMRTSPTVTFYNPSAVNAQVRDTTGAVDCSATASGANAGEKICSISATGNAGTAVGNALDVHLSADAEL